MTPVNRSMVQSVIAEFFATLLGRRRRDRRTAGEAPRPHAPPAAPPLAAHTNPTLIGMLQTLIDEIGAPELEREQWLDLAGRISRIAEATPPPPSFPRIATQLLALARDPNVDVNDLVGLVQRDAAIASTLLRIANSPAFAPATPIATLRSAIQSLGIDKVIELVVGSSGRSYYDVASASEVARFPTLWQGMFSESLANAFSAGRLALAVSASRGESALFAGLLADVGRPIALRILGGLVRDGSEPPSDALALAALDEVSREISERAITAMNLPDELRAACIADPVNPTADAQIARLIASIGAIQRRSPRIRLNADDVRARAEQLQITPYALRSLFAQRAQHVREATELFGGQ